MMLLFLENCNRSLVRGRKRNEQDWTSVERNTTIRVSRAPSGGNGVSASGQHDARYRLYANIRLAKQDPKEDRIWVKRYLIQAQQSPPMLKEQRAYDLLLEYIGRQMNFNVRNQAERAQIARISIDSIVLIETAGHFRRALGIEISMTSLSYATTIGELSRVILVQIYQRTISPDENGSV
ncbi:type I iterative polyketide synthase [Penicillium robsamsonii]|uniref:type I iterative polyketide synthase n=1 Tax=Penicillium robsamsonii TaxID=1792511 RepID=UPI002547CF33|nr:type I iterative polyketide synthase [Penicillium robsamsonii]KAJ5816571.1 type I iterative polyketide synthase [Penicillium robsamsonii]